MSVVAVVAVAIAAVLFFAGRMRDQNFRWDLFVQQLREVDHRWLLGAVAMVLATYAGRAIRWRVLMMPVKSDPSFGRLLSATVIGFTAVTLFGRPGELVRPYLAARSEGVSFSSQVAAWLLERVYDLLIVLLLFGFALAQVKTGPASANENLTWLLRMGGYIVAGLCAVCVAVLVAVGIFSDIARRRIGDALEVLPEQYRARVTGLLDAFLGGMGSTKRTKFVGQLVLYTFGEWLLIIAANYMIFQSFAPTAPLSWVDNMVYLGFVAFGSAVQVPGIGGGMQVAAIVTLTEFFGINLEAATAMSLLTWLVMYVAVVPLGLVLAVRQGLNWHTLKRVSEVGDESPEVSA